jgi:ABC-type ATPase with predicted acetyltransferase domain
MRFEVRNRCSDFKGYRAARVKSLFNAETGCNFDLTADIPIEDGDWKLGLIVGPSGSGKTSLGRKVFGEEAIWNPSWPGDQPIVEAIAPGGGFDDVTGALAAVGLGTVPSWLRPYPVLSNGEQFRANLARLICEAPPHAVVDEFTSVIDRQIAKFGALAFQKAWRRTAGKCVLLSCHYDVIDWLEPDWVFDTSTGKYSGRRLWRRPKFDLELWQTDWRYWPLFEPHHYLKLPLMPAAKCYVGTVDGEPVAHLAMSSKPSPVGKGRAEARGCRLVVMPEWQGAGIGMRFLNGVCDLYIKGQGHLPYAATTQFHTSHPGLCAALRRDRKWRQISASLFGANKARSAASIKKSTGGSGIGYGGHFRAIQGFRYYGEAGTAT